MSDVANWLEQLGLGKYIDLFARNDIDSRALPELNDQDLKELGISLGHRRILLKAIQEQFKEASDLPTQDSHRGFSAWERMPGERKPVTMLFADITGSTQLTEKLDAEDTHELLYGATQRMCKAVEENRGTVCRFMGDGVMAMFGAPVANEQHAVDACAAALAMQKAVADYTGKIEKDRGGKLQIRVGLHSGEVVVLTIGEGDKVEYDASGPTVPIAARMEQTATPGEIFLTEATHKLAAKRIEVAALAPVSVKGISEPVSVFTLHRLKSVEESNRRAMDVPFVGRRAELKQFRGLLDVFMESREGSIVCVRGEPGIGKTRLVEEFEKNAIDLDIECHRSYVLPFGISKGQDPIRALVRRLLNIPAQSDDEARAKVVSHVVDSDGITPDLVVFLKDLLDIPQSRNESALYDAMDNATRMKGRQDVITLLLRRKSADRPMLIIVEDAHWADDVTLSHLASIGKSVGDCPATLLMTSRIEGNPIDRAWLSRTEGTPLTTFELGPLKREESLVLIGSFIDSNDPLAEDCLQRAAGNPLFLEQLSRNAEEGVKKNLPDSIQSIVVSRIDRLSPEDKHAVQVASVIGQHFALDLLQHLIADDRYDCEQLVSHNLIRPESREYLFAHALIQEGVYASLLKQERRDIHLKIAAWYEDGDIILHAQHLDHADAEQAGRAYFSAAKEQSAQGRCERALDLVERGLLLSLETEVYELLCLKGELLRQLEHVQESISTYQQAIDKAVTGSERCRALLGKAEGLRFIEQHDELLEMLAVAETLAEKHALWFEASRILQLRGGVHFMRAELDACLETNETSLQYARKANAVELEAQALGCLGDALFASRRMLSANQVYKQCIDLARKNDYAKVIAANLPQHGQTLLYSNKVYEGINDCVDAFELAGKIHQPRAQMVAAVVGAYVEDVKGDIEQGVSWAQHCLEIARRLGAHLFEATGLEYLGRFAYHRNQQEKAQRLIQQGLSVLRNLSTGMRFNGARILGAVALVSANTDERLTALKEGEQVLSEGTIGHNHLWFYRDAMEASLNMKRWVDVERYAGALESCTHDEPLPWGEFYVARARLLAVYGRKGNGDSVITGLQNLRKQADDLGLRWALPVLDKAVLGEV